MCKSKFNEDKNNFFFHDFYFKSGEAKSQFTF